MIVEIGFDITEDELKDLEYLLNNRRYKYYIEPTNRFVSLEELECQCEGK